MFLMGIAFDHFPADRGIRNPTGRIVHTQFELYLEQAGQRNIDLFLGDQSLFNPLL